MFKYTNNTLNKLEDLLKKQQYKIRYEKGNFKAGYCLINANKVAVVNKFFTQESRINALIDIIMSIELNESELSDDFKSFYAQVVRQYQLNNRQVA